MSNGTILTLWLFWTQVYFVAILVMLAGLISVGATKFFRLNNPRLLVARAKIWNWVLSGSAFGAFIHESFKLYLRLQFSP